MMNFLSAEFILKWMPNGGTAVFIRTALISVATYLAAIGFKTLVEPGTTWAFDLRAFRTLIADTLPWFVVIFAGVYAALYARFASQWNYLASLYNQIMATAVQNPPGGTNPTEAMQLWQAGFIEDAEDLHLVTKPMFASVVRSMLAKPGVREGFAAHAPGGCHASRKA